MDRSRRNFLKTTGCLTIGFSLTQLPFAAALPLQELPGSLRRYPNIDAWLEVLADGSVRVLTGRIELGQGIRTAMAQVAAEELELPMEKVTVTLAETEVTPNEGYTAGSTSVENGAMAVRYAAAAARQRLLELAAQQLQLPPEQLQLDNGKATTKNGSRALTFSQLLNGQKLTGEIKPPVKLKRKQDYRISGTPVHRNDVAQMVKGAPVYVHDLRLPGMVHARIVRPPAYDAVLQRYDEAAVKAKIPGLLKVVANGSFLGVIAAREYDDVLAQQLMARHTQWSKGTPLAGGNALAAHLAALPVKTQKVLEKGAALTTPTLQARYFKPYIMHAATGPSCAVALYDNAQKLQVWSHSQGVYPLREALQELLQLPAERIHVKGVPGSGCYGHNGADDVAAEAALLAMAMPGKPVRLQWSRQDEHGWEPYGSAMLMDIAATLDDKGKITHWDYALRSDTHSSRPGGKAANLLPARYVAKPFYPDGGGYAGGAIRNSAPYYNIPNQHILAHAFKGPLRASALRSLGAFANIFAIESFMDELAEKARQDPFTFRLAHLDDERAIAVVQKLKTLLPPAPSTPGIGVGIAFARYKNSGAYCAVAAMVQVQQDHTIQAQKMWAVVDAGEVINPDGIKNQTEGGMVQACSWALREQVTFDAQHVTSTDWISYPILNFKQSPAVEVVLIPRPDEAPLGAGEAVQGPAGAAVANAVYRACGKRVRDLPILPAKLKG
jgi:CO/xanthine dehydrogenase Mo-binding subunit